MSDEERKIEQRVMPWRFWFFLSTSLLLGLTFIWVLPDRFLNHEAHGDMHEDMDEEAGHAHDMPMMNGSMDGHDHGAAAVHREQDITSGLAVNMNVMPQPVIVGSSTTLSFFVNNKPDGAPVTDLEIEHEKYMHVVGMRDDMNEFFHIHPEPATDKTYSKPLPVVPDGWSSMEELGAYVIYPSGWIIEKEYDDYLGSKTITLNSFANKYGRGGVIPSDGVEVTIHQFPEGSLTLNELMAIQAKDMTVESRRSVTIGGQSATQVKANFNALDAQYRVITMYVPYRSSVYMFELRYLDGNPKEQNIISEFVEMIDSVVFIESETSQPGVWTVDHAFTKPGTYWVWSEVKKDGVNHAYQHAPVMVSGEGEASRKAVTLVRSMTVGDYNVQLDAPEKIGKNMETDLAFHIHDRNGKEVEVEPYLGADMHLVVVKDDGTQFIHGHPETGAGHTHSDASNIIPEAFADEGHDHGMTAADTNEKKINFHVTFPEAGLYKVFAQFRPKGTVLPPDESLTAGFWIRVDETVPFTIKSNWVINGVVSLTLIVLLSLGVKKYLEPRKQPQGS